MKCPLVLLALCAAAVHAEWGNSTASGNVTIAAEICSLPCNKAMRGPVLEDDCNSFFICAEGGLAQYIPCGEGFAFDDFSGKTCVPEDTLTDCAFLYPPNGEGCFTDPDDTSGNWGFNNTGRYNIGKNNAGIGNVGQDNEGRFNRGSMNEGESNIGTGNQGEWNIGDNNAGTGNTGVGNLGTGNIGVENMGQGNIGVQNIGINQIGTDNSGESNIGTGLIGFEDVGVGTGNNDFVGRKLKL